MTKKEILQKLTAIKNELLLLESEKENIISEIGIDAFIDEILDRKEMYRYYRQQLEKFKKS